MASTSPSNQTLGDNDSNNNADASSSYFQHTVCLNDWWLVKAGHDGVERKRLAVAGVASREKEARRVFSSAPIAKRFDVFTLQTVDGVCVTIKGFINKQRTTENGFPSEIFNHFLFGFPPNWEHYAAKFLGGDSPTAVSGGISDSDELATVAQNKTAPPPEEVSHPEGIKNSTPSSFHVSQEETPHEQLSGENRHDVEVPKLFSSKLCINVSVDDLSHHASEEVTGRANIGSSGFQTIGRPKNLEGNKKKKKSVSRCFMKHKITIHSPVSEAVDSVETLGGASGTTAQSGGKMDISEEYPISSAGGVLRSKGKELKMGGGGLNSKRNRMDSVPVVSKSRSETLRNDNCDSGGRRMSHPSDSELPGPNFVNVVKKLDFGSVEDDLQHAAIAKQRQDCGNITAQVGEGESDAKQNNTFRKRTKRKTSFDTDETPTPEVNKKVSIVSPETLNLKRSRTGRLLLPPMEFWRNQVAIYDADHKVCGIKEEIPAVTTSAGSRSGSRKSKQR